MTRDVLDWENPLSKEEWAEMEIVSRSEWGANPPKGTESVTHPIGNVIYTYFTGPCICLTRKACCNLMRKMQTSHMEEGMDDIAYNFLVGGDGRVYEGRGWYAKSDKSLKFNPEWYDNRMDLAYIGDHRNVIIPPVYMVEAGLTWADRGVKQKYLKEGFETTDIREEGREVWDLLIKNYSEEDDAVDESASDSDAVGSSMCDDNTLALTGSKMADEEHSPGAVSPKIEDNNNPNGVFDPTTDDNGNPSGVDGQTKDDNDNPTGVASPRVDDDGKYAELVEPKMADEGNPSTIVDQNMGIDDLSPKVIGSDMSNKEEFIKYVYRYTKLTDFMILRDQTK